MIDPWVIHVVDAIMVFTILEWIFLGVLFRKTGKGVPPKEIALNLFSGLSLMLALRFLLSGAQTPLILAALLAAGVLHGLDIFNRWRR